MRRSRMGGWVVALACALPAIATAGQDAPAAADATVEAVWVENKVSFTYMAFTSYYSCDGLRDKVRWLLAELGARPGFTVRARGCIQLQGPEWAPGVEIVAAFPAPATSEVLARLAADAARRAPAAGAAGAAGQQDPAAQAAARFPARTKHIEFRSSRTSGPGLQDGDCELIDQLLRQDVFGTFGVRVVDAQVSCVPRRVTLGAVRMTVEVLEPVPQP